MAMRIVNAAVAVVLAFLSWRHAGDPSSVVLAVMFGVGAFWNALAALRVQVLLLRPVTMLLSLTMAASLLTMAYFWPDQPGWWQPAMWSDPLVRNGVSAAAFGLSLLAVILATIGASRSRQAEQREAKARALERRHRVALERASLGEEI